jgi:hypothetical protein
MGIAKSQATGGTDHFLGTFVSLVALQTAHPTATLGDYAIVEALPSDDAIVYYWDGSNWDDGIDPSQFLQSGLNLSDLGNIKTARANLGVDKRTTFSNAAYAVLSTDKYIAQVGTMSASRTVTLPAAANVNAGYEIIIADESGTVTTTNTIVVTRAGSDTIDGETSTTIGSAYGVKRFISDGTSKWTCNSGQANIVRIVGSVSNTATDTLADVTGLSFPVVSGRTYRFKFLISYDSSSTAVGSRWSINGPTFTRLAYRSMYSLLATSQTVNSSCKVYDFPAAANGTSGDTSGNIAIIEGVITPSANGTVVARFAREGASGSITAMPDSYVEYQDIT